MFSSLKFSPVKVYNQTTTSGLRYLVHLTENAKKKLQSILSLGRNAKKLVRLSVEPGGCHGFQYTFCLDEALPSDHTVMDNGKPLLAVDTVSMKALKNFTLDYIESPLKSHFAVTRNEAASSHCGCGTSFDLKPDTQNL